MDLTGLEQRTVSIAGLEMHVVLAGTGEPLLLLHGFPDSSKLWRELIPGLVEFGFRVIAPDQRGFGLTTMPSSVGEYTIATIAADAIGLLDVLGVTRAALIGHDWGSIIGWRLAADHPDRFSRFVALSVGHPNALCRSGIRQMSRSWYVALFQWRGLAEALLLADDFLLLRRLTHDEPEIVNWRQDLSRRDRLTAGMNWYRANFRELTKAVFPQSSIPVLGIIGSADAALTVEQMTNSGRFAPAGFESHVIEGAGHWLPLHNAAEVERLAVKFLRAPA